MKKVYPLIFSLLLLVSSCKDKETIHLTPDPNQSDEIYIPKNIEECFSELDKMLSPQSIEKIRKFKEEDMIRLHRGLGLWIRNNWGLWQGSHLKDYLTDLGFMHPDDMSSAILKSYWRYLNGIPIEIEKQAEAYRQYWQSRKPPDNPL